MDMSSPAAAPPTSDTGTPIFVDDSGRRRARVRVVVRVVVGILGLYVALAAISLVAPVSFPIAHLGKLGVLPRHRQNATLGPQSKEAALPAALQPSEKGTGGTQVPTARTSATSTPGRTTPSGVVVPPGQTTTPSGATTIPTSRTTTATTAPTTDTTATTPPTTGPPSTTTLPHGSSTTGAHGPPSSTPGKGSKP
jgi:hypothetical protein